MFFSEKIVTIFFREFNTELKKKTLLYINFMKTEL